jgi:hypothetical protein
MEYLLWLFVAVAWLCFGYIGWCVLAYHFVYHFVNVSGTKSHEEVLIALKIWFNPFITSFLGPIYIFVILVIMFYMVRVERVKVYWGIYWYPDSLFKGWNKIPSKGV